MESNPTENDMIELDDMTNKPIPSYPDISDQTIDQLTKTDLPETLNKCPK
eukprot:CAMPEP_0205822196 /NCGR_PEP_ID=MMETSP0206-20130828/11420_1 /ASSEMBLY_ACC=CAM_ASM_000279 /TAXON_ID=36767 /ORGANISM="Euplotes focardii, Strain TN1" /LENGTH=49 /DNA_ID=CAMNT_0053118255 /DNA_START=1 /DNA_END=150 /DNA_ORIENTATION=+